jgi:cell division protein FtsN
MKPEQLKFFSTQEHEPRRKGLLFSLDTIFFFFVIIVLLVIFSYVLGVERGKNLIHFVPRSSSEEMNQALTQGEQLPPPQQMTRDEELPDEEMLPKSPQEDVETKEPPREADFVKKYVIQVASYSNENIAHKERQLLEQRGYFARLSQKGKYLVIFVGEYITKNEAKNHLNDLKNRYKDCFIRRL